MKIFIAWSGDTSKAIALALRDWLPKVIQAVEPWMSDKDIDKGADWDKELSAQLNQTNFGIVCLTPDNLNAPWLLFEAGALSKAVDESRVWTFLYKVNATNVQPPLGKFQHTNAEKDDVHKLLHSINRALKIAQKNPLDEEILNHSFKTNWQELHNKLDSIPAPKTKQPERKDHEILEEILLSVRTLHRDFMRFRFIGGTLGSQPQQFGLFGSQPSGSQVLVTQPFTQPISTAEVAGHIPNLSLRLTEDQLKALNERKEARLKKARRRRHRPRKASPESAK